MEHKQFSLESKFKSPQEEKAFLQSEILRHEGELRREGIEPHRENIIKEKLSRYANTLPQDVLDSQFRLNQENLHSLVSNLRPEPHDKKIEELLLILNTKGIKNTISLIENMGDSHLEDDFHRFLVQYIKRGFPVKGLAPRAPLSKALQMTLYEVVLPETERDEKGQVLKQLLSGMEQFYAGMLSISPQNTPGENHFVLEIANSNGSDEFVFYVSVPDSKKDLFEKQVLSIFHNARISQQADDHNIFNPDGFSMGSVAISRNNPIFPIKTYEAFDHDPLNVILNSFSKIDRDSEGACLQILFSPAGEYYHKKYSNALEKIQKGVPLKDALGSDGGVAGEVGKIFKEIFFSQKKKESENEILRPTFDSAEVERIQTKIAKPIVNVAIRLITSAPDEDRAETILSHLESAFNQFDNPQGNSLKFVRLGGGKLKSLFRNFAFRSFVKEESLPLNLSELTSLIHFHREGLHGVSQLKTNRVGDAPAPLDLPQEGTLIGINSYRNILTKVYLTAEDRLRHFYTIGQTGTGKSTLLKNMIIQDIRNGEGVCMIDPHGSDILDILANIPPERVDDVIYFDPGNVDRPMALNMLEYDRQFPEQKTFVVNELFNIFQKLYGAVPESMGPMFEQYFRNATMLVIEDPDSGGTLLDVSRVLSNKEFRQMKLSRCNNPVVSQFWREIAEKAGGEGALANIVPYITSKFDVFLSNEIMRPIIAQEHSSFDFRDIMDNKKILLVNLAKGRLGDINANLIGLILVGKILMAALSRVDSTHANLPPFYLYIDEFQNITTPSIGTILSEARKYKLSLSIAHQFIGQLDENIKNAVFGNVGTIACFRVGSDDAEYLAKQFEPVFNSQQLINVENKNAYLKMLVHGKPVKPFNVECMPPPERNNDNVDSLKERSYMRYGRDRAEVEKEILEKYRTVTPNAI